MIQLKRFLDIFSKIKKRINRLEERVCILEEENVGTTNELYRLENSLDSRIDILYYEVNSVKNMYQDLNNFEKALAHFGTRVDMICAMELGGKIDAETAYQNIKIELKMLKSIRKSERHAKDNNE
jgi:hypothetical protein